MSEPPESQVKLWGYDMSSRGILAFLLVATLCALTILYPETFAKAFESTVIAVVAFYFGQSTKKER